MSGFMNTKLINGLILLVIILAASALNAQQFSGDNNALTERFQNSEIDWGSEMYYATGEGAMPSEDQEPNRAKAFLKAKNYAKMAAIANLYMAIEGTTISYRSTGKDYLADTTIRQTLEGYVSNVEVVGEKRQSEGGDTVVLVTVRAPMYGSNGLASALLRSKVPAQFYGNVNIDKKPGITDSTIDSSAVGPFSSIIIDSRGFNIQRAISPKIRQLDGAEVWGTQAIDASFLLEKGIVAYAINMDSAKKNIRAGNNPLIVKAVGRAGGKFYCDPVITNADADFILDENSRSKFLDKLNVIFVIDSK